MMMSWLTYAIRLVAFAVALVAGGGSAFAQYCPPANISAVFGHNYERGHVQSVCDEHGENRDSDDHDASVLRDLVVVYANACDAHHGAGR